MNDRSAMTVWVRILLLFTASFLLFLPEIFGQKAGNNLVSPGDFVLPLTEGLAPLDKQAAYRLLTVNKGTLKDAIPYLNAIVRLNDQQAIVAAAIADWYTSPEVKTEAIYDGWKLSPQQRRHFSTISLPATLLVYSPDKSGLMAGLSAGLREKVSASYAEHWLVFNNLDVLTLEFLIRHPLVWQAKIQDRAAREEQSVESFDPGLNGGNLAAALFPQIDGSGQVISIKEQLFDTTDIDLAGKYISGTATPNSTNFHATIMATMAAGKGNSGSFGKGFAPAAGLASASFSNLLPEPSSYYQTTGTTVQNHSYGVGVESSYAADAAAYDDASWQMPQLLHVFSAGNSGLLAAGEGAYQGLTGWANLTGSFKMSKNSVAVAALDSLGNREIQSSVGPAHDGRIKPELAAFGEDGSSGAAAIVSGIAALLGQQFKQLEGRNAPASLIKSMLVAGADDIGAAGPDFKTGYGIVQAANSLKISGSKQYVFDSIAPNILREHIIDLPTGMSILRICLAWTDTVGMPGTFRALVNDLDLRLVTPTGDTVMPWVLQSSPNPAVLGLPATRGSDSLNVVETISLENPQPGSYKLLVLAKRILSQQQPYGLSWYTNETNQLQFTNPVKGISADTEKGIMLRWQSTYPQATNADLWITNTATGSRQQIGTAIPLSQGYFYWKPDNNNGFPATASFEISGNQVMSDTFVIGKRPRLLVGFNCPDSVMVLWTKTNGAGSYTVYALRNNQLQAVRETTDSFVIFRKTDLQAEWLAVASVIGGKEGPRSATIRYTQQGVGCFINTFFADYFSDLKIADINLTLGTLVGVSKIVIEKRMANIYQPLATYTTNLQLKYNLTDSDLQTGANYYRAAITLTSGRIIYSTVSVAYHTAESDFIVFPNPATVGQNVQLINRFDSTAVAILYDASGRYLRRFVLADLVETLTTADLPAGMYFLVFHNGETIVERKRLLIQ